MSSLKISLSGLIGQLCQPGSHAPYLIDAERALEPVFRAINDGTILTQPTDPTLSSFVRASIGIITRRRFRGVETISVSQVSDGWDAFDDQVTPIDELTHVPFLVRPDIRDQIAEAINGTVPSRAIRLAAAGTIHAYLIAAAQSDQAKMSRMQPIVTLLPRVIPVGESIDEPSTLYLAVG